MSTYLGLGSNSSQAGKPVVYGGLQVSNSQMNMPIVLFWGQRRLGTTAIDYVDFKKNSGDNSKGIKGAIAGGAVKGMAGKGGSGQVTYSAATITALCEGPVDSIVNIFPSGSTTTTTTLSKLNMTLFNGTAAQAPWSYMVTKHPTRARSYPYTAYTACPNMNLGSSAAIPDNGFECVRANGFAYTHSSNGWIAPSGAITPAIDCLMSDIVQDFLINTQYGMGFTAADIGPITQYALYQRAQGFFFSPCLKTQEAATSIIDRWAQFSNSWIYWAGTQYQFVPLGDSAVTGNGVTYTPDNAAAYDLGLTDFIDQANPVKTTRVDPADCYNRLALTITDRTLGYINNPIEWKDQTQSDLYTTRDGSSITADEICDPDVGKIVAQLIGKRTAYIRRNFTFKTSYRRIRCLPGTVLTLTTKRLNKVRVRVTSISGDENGNLSFTAEEFPGGIGTVTDLTQDQTGNPGNSPDYNEDPGPVNTPSVVEPSSAFTGGKALLLLGASGGAKWGGANVFISFDPTGAANYQPIGQITAPAVQGLLTAPLASHVDPDTVNTLSVDMTESQSVPVTTITHADADALRTLSQVVSQPTLVAGVNVMSSNGELLAPGTSVVTGNFSADLTYLRRGEYGTVPGAHITGDQFTVVDVLGSTGTFIDYELPAQYIGQPIFLKFTSYNVFGPGAAEEDLSTVAVYKYVPTGAGYGGGTAGAPTTPTGLAGAPGNGQNQISWNANPVTDNVTSYTLLAAPGLSQPFGSAVAIYNGAATAFTHSGIGNGANYTYFLIANNAIGPSGHTAGVNCTSNASGIGTVSSVTAGTGLTASPNPIVSTGTIALAAIPGGDLLANLTGGSTAPTPATLSAIIDFCLSAATQGDILYRNGTVWTFLPPGTAGFILATGGAAANPSWIANSGLAAIADQRILANISGGSALPVANTLSAILDACLGTTQGDIIYRSGSAWTLLAPGTSGQFLTTNGAGANPSWTTGGGGGGGSLAILVNGVSLDTAAVSLNFVGPGAALSTTSHAVSIVINGTLPLVNGDLPGPSLVADGLGQCIAVPMQ